MTSARAGSSLNNLDVTIRDAGRCFNLNAARLPSSDDSDDGHSLFIIRRLSSHVKISAAEGFGFPVEVRLPIARDPSPLATLA